ncbi:MAG: ShlB/FhaC/HecB family hemolysin secretion/activation protein [Gloeotrichia echinulata DEX184]
MILQFLLTSLTANNLSLAQITTDKIALENPPTIQHSPEIPSTLPPTPEPLLPSSPSIPQRTIQENYSPKLQIRKFVFQGNTVFSNQELEKLLTPFIGKKISFTDLSKISDTITNYYVERGYINSGAYIPVTNNQSLKVDNAIVTVAIIEGQIEAINIVGGERLHNYIRTRIPQPILNNKHLLTALQLLQQDPLIGKISASLKEGTRQSLAILTIYVNPQQEFKVNAILDNSRSPGVSSFQRRVEISHANLLGLGDALSVGYRNTDGSNTVTANYSVPLNSQNGTIGLFYANVSNNIIEEPFTSLDIVSNACVYELSYRQPLLRQASDTSTQEFALGLTASHLESESSLQNTPFPLSAGADANGRTRVFAVRFFQDWSHRSTQEALFVRSQFSWGLDAFDSTINTNAPDGRFFSWLGEALWLKSLGNSSIVVKSRLQLTDRPLPAFEQLSLGGLNTVRGYRQDTFISDNGFLLSTEVRIPTWKTPTQELQVIPFIDFGTAWNHNNTDISGTTGSLTSIGLGIQYRNERFNARLDWGIPLNDTNSNLRTWQENGLYFSLNYQLF